MPSTVPFLQQGIIVNSLRGTDSTGIIAIDKDGIITTYKKALPGWDMQDKPITHTLLTNLWDKRFIFIHNRKATKGLVTSENAHPFTEKHIHLMHNGTVRTTNLEGHSSVDSRNIAITMADKGEDATLSLLDGGFALAWYNAKDESFNLARNDERPLSVAHMTNGEGFFFASEGGMLEWLCARNKIDVGKVEELTPLHHYKIPIKEKSKMKIRKFKEYTSPPLPTYRVPSSSYSFRGVETGQTFDAVCTRKGNVVKDIDQKKINCYFFRERETEKECWYVAATKNTSYVLERWYVLKALCTQPSVYSNKLYPAQMVRKLSKKALAALSVKNIAERKKCMYKAGDSVEFSVESITNSSVIATETYDVIGESIDNQQYKIMVGWQSLKLFTSFENCIYEGILHHTIQDSAGDFVLILNEHSIVLSMDKRGEWTGMDSLQVLSKSRAKSQLDATCFLCKYPILDYVNCKRDSNGLPVHKQCLSKEPVMKYH